MRTQKTALALMIAAVVALTPCAQARNPVLGYFKDRACDVADILRLRVTLPRKADTFGLKVKATDLAQAGYVRFQGDMVGMDGRSMGVFEEERQEFGASLLYYSSRKTAVSHGNKYTDLDSAWAKRAPRQAIGDYKGWEDGKDHPFSLGFEVALPFLPGLDAAAYPEEAADFLLGFLGVDIGRDDHAPIDAREDKSRREQQARESTRESDFIPPRTFDEALSTYEYGQMQTTRPPTGSK